MTYKYNPFWQQRIRETVRHALNVHPRLTALRVDLRFPDVLTRNVSIGKVNACIPQPCITSGPGSLGSAKVKNTIT